MSEQTPNTPNKGSQPVPPVKKSNNKMALLIGFLAIVIIIQGIKIYLDSQEKQEVKGKGKLQQEWRREGEVGRKSTSKSLIKLRKLQL